MSESHFQVTRRSLSLLRAGDMPLRLAQLGALHALASHFTKSTEPALVVLPTGVGKTAIAQAAPYVLEDVTRVLLIVPGKVLRNDTAKRFSALTELTATRLVPGDCEKPRVHELKRRPDDWGFARACDVVVTTPHACSPLILEKAGLQIPEPDLFDLVIVDEGHHVPAATWRALVDHFDGRKILLTATPYRRDRRLVPGSIAYDYPLSSAVDDGAYVPVSLVPVAAAGLPREQQDLMIARRAVERLEAPEHSDSAILVRAKSKVRAELLTELYSQLGVRTAMVHGGLTAATVRRRLQGLRRGEIDAVAFVGILGEGFDHPALKIGAYHDKHKSLPATLQFIGRLARTRTQDSPAEVVTVVEDLQADTWQLYQHDAVWEQLLPDLADSATEEVIQRKTFVSRLPSAPTAISLHEIEPKLKAVVYEVPTPEWDPPFGNQWLRTLGLSEGSRFMDGHVFYAASDAASRMLLIVSAHVDHPTWMCSRSLDAVTYRLHMVVAELPTTADSDVTYIFVASDTRAAEARLARIVANGLIPRVADPEVVNRCMEAFNFQKYHGVGLRAVGPRGAGRASYRNILGSNVDAAVQATDTRAHRLGHAVGTALGAPGKPRSAAGVSTVNARIFESSHAALSGYVDWVRSLTTIIRGDSEPSGRVPLIPSLRFEKRLDVWPDAPIIGTELPAEAFLENLQIENGPDLSRTDLRAIRLGNVLELVSSYEGITLWTGLQNLSGAIQSQSDERHLLHGWADQGTLRQFLQINPPTVFFADGSAVTGTRLSPPNAEVAEVDRRILRKLAWIGVDITRELRTAGCRDQMSVQDYVKGLLLRSSQAFVVLDDGSGELADYLVIEPGDSETRVTFVHCKASSRSVPGLRLADMIEVLDQARRSARWIQQGRSLWDEIARRLSSRPSTRVLSNGMFDECALADACQDWAVTSPRIEGTVVIAQPGLDIETLLRASGGNRLGAAGLSVVETLMHASSSIQTAAIKLVVCGS